MPVSLNTPVLGCDDNAPAEIYARHLKCSPPLSLKEQAWRQYSFELNYPEIMGPDFNNNVIDTDKSTNCSVQVKLELGHKALTRKRATAEGFTHDWTMFVRGPEGSNIQHFVDRVVFHLHESFPKPKRVVKEPPYQINESGYAGFNLPIEIYFKNKDDPKKIIFSYDLFLHTPHAPPVNHVRCEKLTFQNPSEEFRRKLVKAGGVAILGPNDLQGQPPSVTQTASPAHTQAHSPEQYADLFGAPSKPEVLKTSPPKSCPPKIESVKSSTPAKAETTSQKKHKSSASKDRTGGRIKLSSSSSQSSSVSPSTVTLPSIVTPPSTPSKVLQPPQPPSKNSGSKHKDKAAKRALEALSGESSSKKRKEMGATEPSKERNTKKEREKRDQEKAKASEEKEKRDKEKERKKEKKSSSKESKNKHKSSKKDAVKPAKVAEPAKASSALPAEITPPAPPPPISLPLPEPEPEKVAEPVVTPIVVKTLAAKKQQPPSLQMLDELSLGEISGFEDDMDIEIPADMITDVCSPASTLSFSSMKGTTGGEGGGPLGALFAEMDDDEIPLSPLPPTSPPSVPLPIPQPLQQQSRVPAPQILHKPPKITIGPSDTTKEPAASPVESVTSRKEPSPPVQEPAPATGKATKKREKESRRSRTDRRTKEASKENKDVSKDIPASKSVPKDIISKDLFRDYRSDNVTATIEAKSASTVTPGAKEAPCTTTDLGERDMNNISLHSQGQGHQPGVVAPNGESLNVLLELQRRLMGMTDRDLVQQVVNVIEETGMYKISDATFDFDLCSLDIITVKKLQVCLEMQC